MGNMEQAAVPGFDSISSFPRIEQIEKRDGSVVGYDQQKLVTAIYKAMAAAKEGHLRSAEFIAQCVESFLRRTAMVYRTGVAPIPNVETISDSIERELMLHGYIATAKAFILYRRARAELRAQEKAVPQAVRELVAKSKTYFRNPLAEFVYFRTYSRWIEAEGRREAWIETVNRYMDFMMEKLGDKLSVLEYDEICQAILNMEVVPSMRLMWSAGDAARKTNVCAFNCAFIAPTCIQDFAEILYVSACGTGVGFSVESRNIQQLPIVQYQNPEFGEVSNEYIIGDSKEGWADALAHGMKVWYAGGDVVFDYSRLRPEGARLKTMGGRSSGPEPLRQLLSFTRAKILEHQGERISNLTAHDIICKIGDCIVAGGVRRSALISLSDLKDANLRDAKKGPFWLYDNQRQLANNSAVYHTYPGDLEFMREWLALIESKSGERGIFNRGGLHKQVPARRLDNWIEHGHATQLKDGHNSVRVTAQVGTNPCGEINLLSKQFCNLTEVICRAGDTAQDLTRKVRIATILGTYQSMLTHYPYLSKEWKENCDRERLLGVSLTGQWDCETVRDPNVLQDLRATAMGINRGYAEKFGIPASTAITCVKPSGTVSLLTDSAPGCHARFAPYYIRRVQISRSDPLFLMLKDQKVPYYPAPGFNYDTATTFLFEFPVKAPEDSVFRKDLNAMAQLEHWKKMKTCYTEHNPSVTIDVARHEWVDVQHWLKSNWDIVGGLSFLPRDDTVYHMAPYEECTEEKYLELCKHFEGLDYARIVAYEKQDETQGAKELACSAGVCEMP